ncbi:MAG: hypothetical protein HZB50_01530 [Chloroflexi bacterium]|nr:hypothetical protein [Chloroflexota bacterium]
MALAIYSPMQSAALAQQPTGSIPTVTGTPSGATVAVYSDLVMVDVYSGPSKYLYPIPIGVLLAGQEVPAYGYSEDKNYIQIYYPGVPDSVAWVFAPYVQIKKIGPLPLLPSPPIPTSASTTVVNINPTLAAAFSSPVVPTRLPTFTPPVPLVVATFSESSSIASRLPAGLLILGFGLVGALGALISFLRRR